MQRSREDVVSAVLNYNAGRDPERLVMKFAALRRDAHSFPITHCSTAHR
jgi:uncharacterized protein (DUF2252 family)